MSVESNDSIADDLIIGAVPLAVFIYGDPKKAREIYRNPANLPFFRHGSLIAGFKSSLREELRNRESTARQVLTAARQKAVAGAQPRRRSRSKRQLAR